jgi:hypothetical protein
MNPSISHFTKACRLAVSLAFVASWTSGCGKLDRETPYASSELKLMDHERPSHWPADISVALGSLRGYRQNISTLSAQSPPEVAKISELTDVANWLPEVAADSDMPEATWNELMLPTRKLQAALTQWNRRKGAEPNPAESVLQVLDELIEVLTPIVAGDSWRQLGAKSHIANDDASPELTQDEEASPQ